MGNARLVSISWDNSLFVSVAGKERGMVGCVPVRTREPPELITSKSTGTHRKKKERLTERKNYSVSHAGVLFIEHFDLKTEFTKCSINGKK